MIELMSAVNNAVAFFVFDISYIVITCPEPSLQSELY